MSATGKAQGSDEFDHAAIFGEDIAVHLGETAKACGMDQFAHQAATETFSLPSVGDNDSEFAVFAVSKGGITSDGDL